VATLALLEDTHISDPTIPSSHHNDSTYLNTISSPEEAMFQKTIASLPATSDAARAKGDEKSLSEAFENLNIGNHIISKEENDEFTMEGLKCSKFETILSPSRMRALAYQGRSLQPPVDCT
jgi:hypothetical protein